MGSGKSKVKVMPLNVVDEGDPDYYVGEVKQVKKNGEVIFIRSGNGKQTWCDKSMYLGNFKDGEMNGNGTITYPNGSIYTGNWLNGVRHGKGKLISTEGSSYEGDWRFDVRDGNGKLTYDNGDYVVGNFKLDTICGKGKMYNSQKQKIYEGEWLNDQFHGKGSYFFTNGKVQFKGNWCQSLAHGIGIQYDEDGSISQFGVYEDGYFIKDLVEDIYFVLQCHIENEEFFYSVDSSNNLVLEQDVIDWVSRDYQSPQNIRSSPVKFMNGGSPSSTSDTMSGSDNGEYTPPIRSTIEASSPEQTNNSIVGFNNTQESQLSITKQSYANLSTSRNNKHIIKNPLVAVKQTNPFLLAHKQKHNVLPKVAKDIIQKSIDNNTFNHAASPPAVPIQSYISSTKHKNGTVVGNKNKNGFFASLFSARKSKKMRPIPRDAEVLDNPLMMTKKNIVRNPAFGRVVVNKDQHSLIQNSSSKNLENLMKHTRNKKGGNNSENNNVPSVPKLDLNGIKHKLKTFNVKRTKNTFPQQSVQVDNPALLLKKNSVVREKQKNNGELQPRRNLGGVQKKITDCIVQGNGAVNPLSDNTSKENGTVNKSNVPSLSSLIT